MAPTQAARERRLQHIGGVDGAFGLAGADQRMQLVDEQDDVAGGGGDLLQHGLQRLLVRNLAPAMRAPRSSDISLSSRRPLCRP